MSANRENGPPRAAANDDDCERLLVTVETVAALMSVSPRTVWRLVSAGKLFAPVRVGGAVRWHYARLRLWIEQGCPPIDGGRT